MPFLIKSFAYLSKAWQGQRNNSDIYLGSLFLWLLISLIYYQNITFPRGEQDNRNLLYIQGSEIPNIHLCLHSSVKLWKVLYSTHKINTSRLRTKKRLEYNTLRFQGRPSKNDLSWYLCMHTEHEQPFDAFTWGLFFDGVEPGVPRTVLFLSSFQRSLIAF